MRSLRIRIFMLFAGAAACLALLAGCGGGSGANVVAVTVASSSGTTIIVGSSTTLTATVTGATNLGVTWEALQYTTTTVTNGKPTTSTPTNAPTDGSFGTLSNETNTSPATATFTAPSQLPDQTKFPGLQIIITAQSQQNTKKVGTVSITLDSGIGENLTPTTASVPTNEPQRFTAILTNDTQTKGVTWLLTQQTPNSTSPATPFPQLTTCSPACGTLSSTSTASGAPVTYTAPSSVPTACTPTPASGVTCTAQDVTIVASATADNTRFITGTITIVQGGPITFNGISPTIAPQGAAMWDVYLNAPNVSSASSITITNQSGGATTFTSTDLTNQIKILFPIPTTATPNPQSIGARLRLLEKNLVGATSYTFSISDPGEPVTNGSGPFTLTLVPVRPTVVSSAPASVVENETIQNNLNLTIDGGYFGPGASLVGVGFPVPGNAVPQATQPSATAATACFPALVSPATSCSRQYDAALPTSSVNNLAPGLYPLSVSGPAGAVPNGPAVTTLGIFPDYSVATPQVAGSIPASTNPSSIDIDPTIGVLAVAETGSNSVEFFTIGSGTLTSLGKVGVGSQPTGISVNRTNHSVAVVNYGSQNVSIVPIPGAQNPVSPATVDLSSVLQGVATGSPIPYAIGVDPDTNLALVAFSCKSIATNNSCAANLGFVINLNQGANAPFGCMLSGTPPPCVYSQVTLNTGSSPQIAMAPHGHLAFVTPGEASLGGGFPSTITGVDVTHASTSVAINNITLNAGIATVTTSSDLNGLVPGEPATVLISGVPSPPSSAGCPSGTNLNGIFSISVTGNLTFTYALNSNATGTCQNPVNGGTVFYGTPNLSFGGVSSGGQGIAINPITNTAAIANPNATTGQQINLLNQLDLSVTSINFSSTCTFYNNSNGNICPSGGSDLGNADVAWQPYTDSVVSYNPNLNQVSISDPVTLTRRAFACSAPCSTTVSGNPGPITLAGGPGAGQATINSLALFGGIAVDPDTNQAFVAQSGNNAIQIVNLNSGTQSIKPVNVTEVVVPCATGVPGCIGGLPKGFLPQGTVTSTTPVTINVFGSGFVAGSTTVLLDGQDITAQGGSVTVDTSSNGRHLTATIPGTPAPFLSRPHRFALTVSVSGGGSSNATDFIVVKSVDMTAACASPSPSSVAIADQLKNGPFSPIAVVTNSGCSPGSVSVIDINPANATFGTILTTTAVGSSPQGIAVSQPLGYAVVANNGDGTASIVNLTTNPPSQAVPPVTTGPSSVGVAINDSTGVALVANFSDDSVSQINLGLLPASSLTATTIHGVQHPIAVAIDPDAGTNNQGLALVTGLQLTAGSSIGALYPVDIGLSTPTLSTTVGITTVASTPTGIVFDPAVNTGSSIPGLFYVNSSGGDTVISYNDNTGGQSSVTVGINPTALAVNPQTGAILTTNFAGKSVSIVDTLSNPFRTRATYGLPGSAQFGVAIDQFTNLAVVVDQANNRVLLFAMPD